MRGDNPQSARLPLCRTFGEFWPVYVREHHLPSTRCVHFLGTTLALAAVAAAIAFKWWWVLAAAPVCGYGCAWLSHALLERNRPATFSYPLWSLAGDFRMWWLMLTGRMSAEVRRVLDPPPEQARNRQRGG